MILTRTEIAEFIEEKKIVFTPNLDKFQNQPHAVDLRLGTVFYIPKIWKITEKGREIINVDVTESAGDNFEKISLSPSKFFELAPGESIIASTLEKISLNVDDVMGVLYPRSSINRRGLSVDLTGIVDVFYSGYLMIPILNKTKSQIIKIYPGERICQLVFHKLASSLNREDAMMHGAVPAKYENSNEKNLTSKKDAQEEIDFLKKGDLKGLKKECNLSHLSQLDA